MSLNVSTWRSRKDEEVRLRDRVDVADRDEAVGACTWSPSATSRQNRQSSGGDGKDSLLRELRPRARARAGRPRRRRATACSRRRSRGPGRSTRTRSVDADPRRPATAAELVGERAQARAPLLLHLGRDGVGGGGRRPGRGEYGKTCTFVIPARSNHVERRVERRLVLAREADDDVGGEIEVAQRRRASRGTAPTSSGAPSRGARRRRPTAAGRGDGATRPASRAAPRRARRPGGSPRSTRAAGARRPGSRRPRGRVAASVYPASRSRKQPRLTPVRTISR